MQVDVRFLCKPTSTLRTRIPHSYSRNPFDQFVILKSPRLLFGLVIVAAIWNASLSDSAMSSSVDGSKRSLEEANEEDQSSKRSLEEANEEDQSSNPNRKKLKTYDSTLQWKLW